MPESRETTQSSAIPATSSEAHPQQAPLKGTQSSERIEVVDKAIDMARGQKESWDAAMRYKRLAQIQRDAGYNDLAETAESKAAQVSRCARHLLITLWGYPHAISLLSIC